MKLKKWGSEKELASNSTVSMMLTTELLAVNQSHYRPEVPRGFQEVKVPRLRASGPEWW